jgi:hypothetical protein
MQFDLLDESVQSSILRRREAESVSSRNRQERKYYFHRALFHRWREEPAAAWIRECIFQGLVKNYKLKKSGVKMTLDQKHLYEKVVRPVELILKKIMKQEPIVMVSLISEKQALLSTNKETAAAAETVTKSPKGKETKKSAVADGENKDEPLSGQKRRLKRQSTNVSTSMSAAQQEEAGTDTLNPDFMTPHEVDKMYMHAFNVFSNRMATIFCRILSISIIDLKVIKLIRLAHFTASHVRIALFEADEMLKKSPITALLPKIQFKEKVLVAGARKLYEWTAMIEMSIQLSGSFKVKDKTWRQKAINCLSSCLIMKYASDEKARSRGEYVAASILQGLVKGFLTRLKLKKIWEVANLKYDIEYQIFLEKQLAEKEIKDQQDAIAAEALAVHERKNRKALLRKVGVDWSEAYVHDTSRDGVTLQINMRIGGKLPLKDYFRNKLVTCTVRLYEAAGQLHDVDCTGYVAGTRKPKTGQLEVLIDEKKSVDEQTIEWNRYSSNVLLPSSITWDSSVKLKKSKLINVYDLNDEASAMDIATCFISIKGLIHYACYNVKLIINPHYNPVAPYSPPLSPSSQLTTLNDTNDANKDDKKKKLPVSIAVLEFITNACAPKAPKFKKPDIIHFDHVIPTGDHKFGNKKDLSDEDLKLVEEAKSDSGSQGLSVVDRLEKFKVTQLERKQMDFNVKNAIKKGN